MDVAATALRLGAGDVRVVCLESREKMPALDEEIQQAIEEGVKLDGGWGPKRILAVSGRVKGIELKRCVACYNESGKFSPVYDENDEKTIDADMVITAIGERPDLTFMTGEMKSAISGGLIKANPVTLETCVEGVFAGGDAVTGAATVIQALAAGRKAAVSIVRYLNGEPLDTAREDEAIFESKLIVDTWGVAKEVRLEVPVLPVAQRRGNFNEVELGLSREGAIREAKRCLSCDCRICINLLGCPALITDSGKVVVEATQCPGCGVCAQVCPHDAIKSGA
jgi:NADPH-dependent glutamate synthase beta subunit-like oxidoreductase